MYGGQTVTKCPCQLRDRLPACGWPIRYEGCAFQRRTAQDNKQQRVRNLAGESNAQLTIRESQALLFVRYVIIENNLTTRQFDVIRPQKRARRVGNLILRNNSRRHLLSKKQLYKNLKGFSQPSAMVPPCGWGEQRRSGVVCDWGLPGALGVHREHAECGFQSMIGAILRKPCQPICAKHVGGGLKEFLRRCRRPPNG
jgi:hypothetical protein